MYYLRKHTYSDVFIIWEDDPEDKNYDHLIRICFADSHKVTGSDRVLKRDFLSKIVFQSEILEEVEGIAATYLI